MSVIKPGDMVRVGSGQGMTHGVVDKTAREGATRGHIIMRSVCREHARRDVRISEVTAHWKLVKR